MDNFYFLGLFLYLFITVNAKVCEVNSDCNSEAVCTNGLCACEVGKISSNDGSRCLNVSIGIGSECIEDIQCLTSITGPSVCTKDLLCGCEPGYRYADDKCIPIKRYKEDCSTNSDCFDGINLNALSCENDACGCSKGYYLRGDSDCRLSAKNTGKCFFDIDCESETKCCEFKYGPTGVCVSKSDPNNTCSGLAQPDQKSYETYKTIRLNRIDVDCATNNDCSKIKNSFCFTLRNKCTCRDGFLYNKYTNRCVKGLGSSCDIDADCPIMNSKCNANKMCSCKDYFVNSNYNDKCFKPARGMNMSCARDENCYSLGIYGICNKNKCDCKFNSEYDEKLMMCVPATTPETGGCENDCVQKPHSTCVKDKCQCEENYISENNKCLPDLGYECNEELRDCVIENAQCTKKKCECLDGYLKLDKRICVKEITDKNETCTENVQCEKYLGTGGMCSSGNCTCQPEFDKMIVNEKDVCVLKRTFGEQCSLNVHCKTLQENAHVVCRNSKCVCDYDYHLVEDEKGQRCESGSSVLLISNLLIWSVAGILLRFNHY